MSLYLLRQQVSPHNVSSIKIYVENSARMLITTTKFACLLYFLSIVWWAVFPLVSITTGELKTRQIYVDENALLVNSVASSFAKQWPPILFPSSSIQRLNDSEATMKHVLGTDEISKLVTITLDSSSSSQILELISFIIFHRHCNRNETFLLVDDFSNFITGVKWLSKRVVLHVIEVDSSSDVYMLGVDIVQHVIGEAEKQNGLIREVYILDLRLGCSAAVKMVEKISLLDGGNVHHEPVWDVVELLLHGENGVLPNMDMVAAALALFPFVSTEVGNKDLAVVAYFGRSIYNSIVKFVVTYGPDGYSQRMTSLLRFSATLLRSPHGSSGSEVCI